MSVVAEKRGRYVSRWNLKKALWITAFVAGSGIAAGWLFQSQEQQEQAGSSTEPTSLNCPTPPCMIIIVDGRQRCVYQNNQFKSCP